MTEYLGLMQQGLFFGFMVVAVTAVISALAFPLMAKSLAKLNPETRAALLFLLCLLPLALMFVVLLSALLPSVLQLAGLSTDHCLGHVDGHLHFCLVHLPPILTSWSLTLPALIFLGLIVKMVANFCTDIFNAWRFRRILRGYQAVKRSGPLKILATPLPLAFSFGLARQEIYLSTGLLKTLSARERKIIIAHEKSHLQRHDSLLLLLARTVALAHLPHIRQTLLAQLYLACEQSCDAAAAKRAGDSGTVAELLLKIEKLYHSHFVARDALALGILGNSRNSLPLRIDALLAPALRSPYSRRHRFITVFLLLAILTGHDLLHTALEHVLILFTGV